MNTTITLEIELTERQVGVLPREISEELYEACDKRIGELMIESTNKEKGYFVTKDPEIGDFPKSNPTSIC